MAGISLLRPQYSNLGSGVRLASGARQVAHEADQGAIAGLSESHANGGQEEAAPQEIVAPTFEQRRDNDKGGSQQREHPAAPAAPVAAPRDAGGEFHVDPHLPPPERMAPAGLVVAQPLPMPERLRAAEQAYGATRDILQGGQAKPGNGFDAAS